MLPAVGWWGGSSFVWVCYYPMDPELFHIAGVGTLLWRIKDFASDFLVRKLCPSETVEKLYSIKNEESGSIAMLGITLYFLCIWLHAVNAKVLGFRDRINLIWSCTIFITSLGYKSSLRTKQQNMLANHRNMVTEAIGIVFLMVRDDIVNAKCKVQYY